MAVCEYENVIGYENDIDRCNDMLGNGRRKTVMIIDDNMDNKQRIAMPLQACRTAEYCTLMK